MKSVFKRKNNSSNDSADFAQGYAHFCSETLPFNGAENTSGPLILFSPPGTRFCGLFKFFFLFLEQSSFPLKPLFVAFARFKRQHLEMKTHQLLQNYSRFRSRFLLTWRRDVSLCSSEFQLCCLLTRAGTHTVCKKKKKNAAD